jgi:hypothetical protein
VRVVCDGASSVAGGGVATGYNEPAEVGEATVASDLALAPWVYVYELRTGGYSAASKMVVVE